MRMPTLMRTAALIVAVLGLGPAAQAAPITYTQTGMASGSLGGIAFTNQLVTLTVMGNTNNVVTQFIPEINGSISYNTSVVTRVSIPGLPVALVTQPTAIYAFPFIPNSIDTEDELPDLPFVLIGTLDSPPDPLEFTGLGITASNLLGGYDLRSSLGPLAAPGQIDYGAFLLTNRGDLRITGPVAAGTFSATVTAPEPTSMLLLASGLAGAIARRARARRRA